LTAWKPLVELTKVPLILGTPEEIIELFPFDAVIEQFVQISCPLPLLIATPVAPALIAEFKQITLPDEVELIPAPVETAAPVIVQDEVVTFPGPKLLIA
jgi:hypothetical protein